MGRLKDIADTTDTEQRQYLDYLGWEHNPFLGSATIDEYVLPNPADVADVADHIQHYTGPVVIHSGFSGVGKTTLLQMLLDDLGEDYHSVYVGEHNVTPYELAALVADDIGVGKSNSTKLTERKLRNHEYEEPILLGIDEIGLNDPGTIHVIQFLNDLEAYRVVLTGMTSQWEAVKQLGPEGRAFARRASFELNLGPLSRAQTVELYQRRVASVTDYDHDDFEEVPLAPFGKDVLDVIHERGGGIPAVMVAAMADIFGLAAYRYANHGIKEIGVDLADEIEYADPVADETAEGEWQSGDGE